MRFCFMKRLNPRLREEYNKKVKARLLGSGLSALTAVLGSVSY